MEIIGEKINGTRKRVVRAIAERDADFVRDLARRQAQAGSAWLDVNAGTHPMSQLYAGLPGRTVQRIGRKGRLCVGTGPLD